MTNSRLIAPDVHVATSRASTVALGELDFLEAGIPTSGLGRVRLCIHPQAEERLHEMFIAFAGDSYVRPGLHLGKDESLQLLRGSGDCHFFDAEGRVTESLALDTYASGLPFYCRVPAERFHALVPRADRLLGHEITLGPFRREDNVPAAWAPEASDVPRVRPYVESLPRVPRTPPPPLRCLEVTEGVYVPGNPVVGVTRGDLHRQWQEARARGLRRTRLHTQDSMDASLQECFVLRQADDYEPPRRFESRASSLHVLEGTVESILFRADGSIDERVLLSPEAGATRPFYRRIPASTWHLAIPRSEVAIWRESTSGPSVPDEPRAPAWAPAASARSEGLRWLAHLETVGTP